MGAETEVGGALGYDGHVLSGTLPQPPMSLCGMMPQWHCSVAPMPLLVMLEWYLSLVVWS